MQADRQRSWSSEQESRLSTSACELFQATPFTEAKQEAGPQSKLESMEVLQPLLFEQRRDLLLALGPGQ